MIFLKFERLYTIYNVYIHTIFGYMKFSVIADDVTLSKGCACSTLVKWFTVLIFSLVVVASLIRNSFIMSVSINWKKTSTVTCSSISCKEKNNDLLNFCFSSK